MILWRVSNANYADLQGTGGLHVSGRWHTQGRPIVYMAEHPALAMLEVRVHLDLDIRFLTRFVMMRIEAPDALAMTEISDDPGDEENCQALGNAWLASGKTALCKVRSALAPESSNYLLNPLHRDAAPVRITGAKPFSFDARLFS